MTTTTVCMCRQGAEWSVYRAEFGRRMLCPSATQKLVGPFNAVADDLVRRLRQVRDEDGEGERQIVRQLPNEMYKWSLEGSSPSVSLSVSISVSPSVSLAFSP